MFSKITLALLATTLLATFSFARELQYKEGFIQAQTSVLGDSTIDPKSTAITANLSMDDTPLSLKGIISLPLLTLKSDNEKRDDHMYEALKTETNKEVTFAFKELTKVDDGYNLKGTLTLNKVSKEITTKATIDDKNNQLNLAGDFEIKMSDFGIEPPTLFFLTVRDEVKITYNLTLANHS